MIPVMFHLTFHVDSEAEDRVYRFSAQLPVMPQDYEAQATVNIGPRMYYVQEMELLTNATYVVLKVTPYNYDDEYLPDQAEIDALVKDGWVRQ